MGRWLVEVTGDRFDTEEVPYWFPNGDIFGVEADGHVYLTGSSLEECIAAEDARKRATSALEEMSAAIGVLSPKFVKPVIGSVLREDDSGARHVTVFPLAASIRIRGKVRASLTVPGSESTETQAQMVRKLAQRRPQLLAAAMLWAEGARSWNRLSLILEEIEGGLGQHVDQLSFCSRNERERFTRCSNSKEVAGKDARHAGKRFSPPAKPMTLEQARNFVHLMLHKALAPGHPSDP